MFSGFDLTLNEEFFGKDIKYYSKIGAEHINDCAFCYNDELCDNIKDGLINGSELQSDWFPEIEADVFISHSHNDVELANALAGWLNNNFGLEVFVDSNIWGNSNKLFTSICREYWLRTEDIKDYNFDDVIRIMEHVNIMLATALQNMIDKVECVVLLNTKNSFYECAFEGDGLISKTYSPWIYSEMMCTKIVRQKPLLTYRDYYLAKSSYVTEGFTPRSELCFSIFYNVSLEHLVKINKNDLAKWLSDWVKKNNPNAIAYYGNSITCDYPLDYLYKYTHKEHLENTKQLFAKCDCEQIKRLKYLITHRESNDILDMLIFDQGNSICNVCCGEMCPLKNI